MNQTQLEKMHKVKIRYTLNNYTTTKTHNHSFRKEVYSLEK